jgi:hypothetical protein
LIKLSLLVAQKRMIARPYRYDDAATAEPLP